MTAEFTVMPFALGDSHCLGELLRARSHSLANTFGRCSIFDQTFTGEFLSNLRGEKDKPGSRHVHVLFSTVVKGSQM